MKNIFYFLLFIFSLSVPLNAISYLVATGKDSITYLATSEGLVVLTRDSTQALVSKALFPAYKKVYTKALDNDQYLIMATNTEVDLFSLQDKISPVLIGSYPVTKLISIRPFGANFILFRGQMPGVSFYEHYVIGVENDSVKKLSGIELEGFTYSGKTMFYPEAVYPYLFTKAENSQYIKRYKYIDSLKIFNFLDSLNIAVGSYTFKQLFGAVEFLFVNTSAPSGSGYTINTKKYSVQNDNFVFLAEYSSSSFISFVDEIECTEELIRFNGWYKKTSNYASLTEPNQLLTSYPNLSGGKIYSTVQWGVPNYSRMYYSKNISGTVINSARYIYSPPLSSDEPSENPSSFRLDQNYPNPFNPVTTISYYIPYECNVEVNIFDCLGQMLKTVVNEIKTSGNYSVELNLSDLSSGVYYYRLKSADFTMTKKLLLLK